MTPGQTLARDAAVARDNSEFDGVLDLAKRVSKDLARLSAKTDYHAMFLANLCVEYDAQYGCGETLCLEWLLDHYMAMEFERRVEPMLRDVVTALGVHSERNKFLYFGDKHAFVVPHEKKSILVCGSSWDGASRYLCVNEKNFIFQHIYVRLIWRRIRHNCIGCVAHPTLSTYRNSDFANKYGDARDVGHVMTYQKRQALFGGRAFSKCDKVIWDINKPLGWFFEIARLYNALTCDREGLDR